MKAKTAQRVAIAIQMIYLDGRDTMTDQELSAATGVNRKTIQRHKQLIESIKFSLNKSKYHRCILAQG